MKLIIRKYWKQILFISVLLSSWAAFLCTSMPGDEVPVRYFKAMYFAANLFIFGALDIGFPHSGSTFALIVLWICYFIAPAFTISYAYIVIEEKLLNRLPFHLKNHSVFFGMGRTGMFLFESLRRTTPQEKTVIIDRNLQNPNIPLFEKSRSVWWVRNDFEQEKVLLEAKVNKAKRVYITTNNDLQNLLAAFRCLNQYPQIEKIYCHLQNYTMHHDFTDSLKPIRDYEKIRFFNAYTSAAKEVLKLIRPPEDTGPDKGKVYVFMGFGHFGHTLFDEMSRSNYLDKNDEVIIATLKPKFAFDMSKFKWDREMNPVECTIHPPVYKDIFTAELWDDINRMTCNQNKALIIINCLDNDEANISLAVQIKKNGPEKLRNALIYCRTFKPVSRELEFILENSMTETESKDIILFSMETALHDAYNELIKN